MKDGAIQSKSFDFAVRVVNLYKHLTAEKKEYVLSKQLLRSGAAIGALVREAEQAETKADFVHKMASYGVSSSILARHSACLRADLSAVPSTAQAGTHRQAWQS